VEVCDAYAKEERKSKGFGEKLINLYNFQVKQDILTKVAHQMMHIRCATFVRISGLT
jgi:hypothetical protein